MNPNKSLGRYVACRVAATLVVAWAVGTVVGWQTGHAETQAGLYVEMAGNVATVSTVGRHDEAGIYYATGYSSAIQTMHYIRSYIRNWHFGVENASISHDRFCYSCTAKATDEIAWVTLDWSTTQSKFRKFAFASESNYYTSYLDGLSSCYGYWVAGEDC